MARTSGGLVKRSYSIREDQERFLDQRGQQCDPTSASAALREVLDEVMRQAAAAANAGTPA